MTDRFFLATIVGAGFASRAVAIWLSRPEFVGWFNHSYYYWVQARSILDSGQMAYADLPMIFYAYAGLAAAGGMLGFELESTIVNGTRIVMSLVPALVAIPVFAIFRKMNEPTPLSRGHWLLVGVATFLPLTFTHMPELLQKNALGMLLVAVLLNGAYNMLTTRRATWLATCAVLFLLIALTHLGSLAVASLFAAAFLVALVAETPERQPVVATVLLVSMLIASGVATVYVLDMDAFARILRYAWSSLPNSLLGGVFSAGAGMKLAYLSGVVLPPAMIIWLWRIYRRIRHRLGVHDRVFWLANIVLVYLLVLPVIDLDIVVRLVLFLPLPLLVIVGYHLRYGEAGFLNRTIPIAAAAGCALLVVGEAQNLVRLYPDKDRVHTDLLDLKARYNLTESDFVLTQYAVNPAVNWFLGTKSGLVTAFNREDLNTYERVFVLNTGERRVIERASGDRVRITSERDKFDVVRENIRLPSDVRRQGDYDRFDWYELHQIPQNWLFDAEGNWAGWAEP